MGSWELHLRSGRLHWSAETCAIFGVERSPEEEGLEALLAGMREYRAAARCRFAELRPRGGSGGAGQSGVAHVRRSGSSKIM
jgi:hypothetical protein